MGGLRSWDGFRDASKSLAGMLKNQMGLASRLLMLYVIMINEIVIVLGVNSCNQRNTILYFYLSIRLSQSENTLTCNSHSPLNLHSY